MSEPVYENIDHALSRAYGSPRPDYGKTIVQGEGVMRTGSGLSPVDRMTQDGMVHYLLETELSVGDRMMFRLLFSEFDPRSAKASADALCALDMFTEIFTHDREGEFVRESISRWSKRRFMHRVFHIAQWAAQYNMKPHQVRDRRMKIYRALGDIQEGAFGRAKQLLDDRGLLYD